jgi:hypothetical protein
MTKEMLKYTIEYLKDNTSINKQIINNDLDLILQNKFNLNCALGDKRIREIIHDIRIYYNIENKKGESGWICGSHDGYFISYNPYEISKHLQQFEGKINKMKMVLSKGESVLKFKLYYKQSELFLQAI